MLNTHLRPEDRRNFKAVTGQSLGDLLTDKLWETLTPGDWENVMGTTDRIIHPLNSKGLQVLRALLSERIIDYLRRRRSPRARKGSLAEKFERDGILVLPLLSYDRRLELSKPSVIEILKAISGFASVESRVFKRFKVISHIEHGEQAYFHVDTFFPTWKVWLFPPNVKLSSGPFHYIRGSHRNTRAKMAWWFNRSRLCVPGFVKYRSGVKQKPIIGPYDDALHGACGGAMRVEGFNPASPTALRDAQRVLEPYGFDPTPLPAPITTGSEPVLTLVIADTSGFHARGHALVGATRNQSRIDGGGGGCGAGAAFRGNAGRSGELQPKNC
jgi:hypothetical protein